MREADQVLFALLGGSALLLYGVRLVGEGLQRAAGARLRHVLASLSSGRLRALLVGAGVTALLQSSSAITVMLVGFASAGLLSLRQTIGVILGADIGTTLTVQLLAFDLLAFAPLIVFIGWLMTAVSRSTAGYIGRAVLGFGLLFLGMRIIAEGTAPLRGNALFADVMAALVGLPIVVLLLAAGLTALVHSSAAVIGLALSFAQGGMIPLEGAIPIIFGANVGTAATALLAALGANAEARRVAVAHAGFKVAGVAIALPFMLPFAELVRATAPDVPRQIANAHTLFNVGLAVLFLPLADVAARVITRLIPETSPGRLGAIYLNPHVLDTPSVAIGQAVREVLRMGDVVLQSLRDTIRVYERNDVELMRELIRRDDQVDLLEEDIKRYLIRLSEHDLTEAQSERQTALLFSIVNLEEIGDVIDKDLLELAEKKIRGHHRFSDQGWAEIKDLHAKVCENLELAISAIATQDPDLADKVIRHKANVNQMERVLRAAHMDRLRSGLPESIDTSSIHLDVLAGLKRANSLAAGIAYAVLGQHQAG